MLTIKLKKLLRKQPYTIQEIHDALEGRYTIPSILSCIRYLRHCDIGIEAIGNRETRHYYLPWFAVRRVSTAAQKVLELLQRDTGVWWSTDELVAVTDVKRNTITIAIGKLIKEGYTIEKDRSGYPYSYRLCENVDTELTSN